MDNQEPTIAICARLSKVQHQKLRQFIGDERMSDYIRRLIEADFLRHDIEWEDYEFIDNDKRRKP